MDQGFRHYLTVTGGYWAFTLTDGALRMLVLLYFHQLGYAPLAIAMLFIFYEFFGIVTNLVGGWLGARIGLNRTMHIGMALQIVALAMLLLPEAMLTVLWVMMAQALSGIAKDLNKMSAKAGVKLLLPTDAQADGLFRWVAFLTGSKNALKGIGFFMGGFLLASCGFAGAVWAMIMLLVVSLVVTMLLLPANLGRLNERAKFSAIFSKSPAVNWLSAARFFLFGARDVWFVVALPLFLQGVLGWSFTAVGGFFALWVIGYGVVQSLSPALLPARAGRGSVIVWGLILAMITVVIALMMQQGGDLGWVVVVGLAIFGIVFAINSALHSYLIVSWSDHDRVSMNVGFYYMANAGGRLVGTLLSGWIYQWQGLELCLWVAAAFALLSALLAVKLPAGARV
ncbi:MAG: organoarsenical effux MFS transporter ArsJ [Zetaproteobacteria bacterium]|nr:organoarsenical effux MFS transporter ArsJ [Zetaproteobacteria bacterium]